MSSTTIYTLPSTGTSESEGSGLRDEIEAALMGNGEYTIPGDREEDKAWKFKRSVPTVVLYDEQGLRLYDRITAEASEYYLFNDELNLLRNHGADIARSMGFPGRRPFTLEEQEEERDQGKQERKKLEDELHNERGPERPWKPARWGDTAVGKWNHGVNGEEGIGGGFERGYDVVELGAGALRKTAHLLTALAGSVPESAMGNIPITYHPLDLSYPELDRVLGEMDDAYGDKLKGKVECIGLHGDYNAGLQFIRDGKLAELRQKGQGKDTLDSPTPVTPPFTDKDTPSPPFSPVETQLGTPPGGDVSPLLSATFVGSVGSDAGLLGTSCTSNGWSRLNSKVPTPQTIPEGTTDEITTSRPLHVVFLGSSLGNFPREAAAPFLKSLPLQEGDTLLLGLDGRPAPGEEGRKKVEVAYNDPAGHTRAFEEYGWEIVRRELGLKGDEGVEFVGRYNEVLGRHEAYFRSKADQTLYLPGLGKEVTLAKDELLNIEWSYKYSLSEALTLFTSSDLRVINSWKAPDSEYRLWLLERPVVRFTSQEMDNSTESACTTAPDAGLGLAVNPPNQSVSRTCKGMPTWSQWEDVWRLWDHITLKMIPQDMLHTKPIDLRHICLFYLGHIPTFLDIYLTRLTGGKPTHPEFFKDIFERGIDPDVDDPTKIHDHSEVPVDAADWPALAEILAFRTRVRERLRSVYDKLNNGTMTLNRRAGRTIFMAYEHEGMHAETLLYMLIQSPATRPPSCIAMPKWDVLAKRWEAEAAENSNEVLEIPAGKVTMGHNDVEDDDDKFQSPSDWAKHEFGWDLENPQIQVKVKAFKVDVMPISNADYLSFAQKTGLKLDKDSAPASWFMADDGKWNVRTLYGAVGFDIAGRWPVQASKNELEAYAAWKGGRLPTEPELRAFWEHEEGARPMGERANVGFKNWHPIPAEKTEVDNSGVTLYGHNGGVWEWTTTSFEGFKGYTPSKLYPGYSADFFDNKHYVVLGGSYATIPQMAGRKSFRNWYQGNYRFSFIGGRVAYDI